MMIFLSLHTINVNPPAKNVNPLKKKPVFTGGGKTIVINILQNMHITTM
jgi:hypothetical protein